MNLYYTLDDYGFAPVRAHDTDAGWDIRAPKGRLFELVDGDSIVIHTGLHVLIPDGYVGLLKSKSGLNVRSGITGEGVIDAGYTGEIVVKLYRNDPDHTREELIFSPGDKIIQLVVVPIPQTEMVEVSILPETNRGSNGFGSSGK